MNAYIIETEVQLIVHGVAERGAHPDDLDTIVDDILRDEYEGDALRVAREVAEREIGKLLAVEVYDAG